MDVRYCGACKEVELKADELHARDEQRAKQLGRKLPTGHRRYSVRPNPDHA